MLSDMMQPARSLDADESSVTTVTRHFLFLFLSRQQKQNNTKWCVIIGKKKPGTDTGRQRTEKPDNREEFLFCSLAGSRNTF